jgi:hypothetical protein
MEKRTEQSEAVCGRVLMFCVFFFSLALVTYIIFPSSSLDMRGWHKNKEVKRRTGTARKATLALVNVGKKEIIISFL